jgi:transposase
MKTKDGTAINWQEKYRELEASTARKFAEIEASFASMIEELTDKIKKLEMLNHYYEEQLRLAKHRQFGASSEKNQYNDPQPSLFNEAEVTADPVFPEPDLADVEKHYRKAKRRDNDRLPENLPAEVIHYELPADGQACPVCQAPMHIMGREIRRELKIIPARVSVVEHVQHIYSCRNCENHDVTVPVVKAAMPEPVIKGSFASPEAVAHIMAQKFVMGSPLYRLEQEFLRDNILLSRQTMSNWLIRCAEDWLQPIYERMKALLTMHDVLFADETTLQVLEETGKPAQSKSYMWLYRTGGDVEHSLVLYEYQPDRRAIHPLNFLRGFRGYLHADGYEGYHKLPETIIVVGCFAHCRRKYDEALKALPEKDRAGSLALRGVQYCDKVFTIERQLSGLPPDERYAKRQELAKPVVEEFFTWAESLKVIPKSGIGKAVYYTLSQRKYLERYLLDGRLECSNNRSERSIKPFVIGRKNWLFNKTPRGAQASSMIYSLVETAKENGLNPAAYLTHVFKTAPNVDFRNDPEALESLMPWRRSESEPAGAGNDGPGASLGQAVPGL